MPEENNNSISNKTIAILIVLALVISIIGTWAVLNEVNTQKKNTNSGGNIGIITLNVLPQEEKAISGEIILEIK
jgi:hypothetical protein